jgi:hypothetical protein
MAHNEEIPIESHDPPENTREILASVPEHQQDMPQDIPKKGRGRPAGAKNKPKPKPAPKAKPKAKQKKSVEHEEYDEESEEEEAVPPRRRVQREPQELDRHALASDVLNILQQ